MVTGDSQETAVAVGKIVHKSSINWLFVAQSKGYLVSDSLKSAFLLIGKLIRIVLDCLNGGFYK